VKQKEPLMNFEQALDVVEQYQQDWALPGLLETLEQMHDSRDQLTERECRAYRVVFNNMARLFAPA
jgi:hypothetical protein